MRERDVLVLGAVSALFIIMAASFIGVPWPTELHEIPVYDPGNSTSSGGIANSLFQSFPMAVILIGILLGAAMVGGIYLAKMEGGEVGP